MHSADAAILDALGRSQPEYLPLVANRLGMHLDYVDRRCQRLVEYGLMERVTGEAVYRLTDRGERYLAGEFALGDVPDEDLGDVPDED
jgi:DNA-binding IclR family transcriptional regulator